MKKIAYAFLTAAMAGGMALGTGGVASAGHCVEDGEPGFSYFGTDHVQEDKHTDGQRGNAEGNNDGGPNGGTQGASSCNDDDNPSPSERAPGKNKG